jgi:hypothetical protein
MVSLCCVEIATEQAAGLLEWRGRPFKEDGPIQGPARRRGWMEP